MVEDNLHSPNTVTVDAQTSDHETDVMHVVDGAGYSVLKFDTDDYREYIQDMGLTEEQEHELLEALWSIIVGFVDLGFCIETKSRNEERPGSRNGVSRKLSSQACSEKGRS